jgi:glycosyltransferase involved in cell wall biosynthesis
LLLGSGEYKQKVQQWAADRGWSNRVKILLANHSDVPRFLGSMDMMVAPSQTMKNWREQFGRMIIEAFACGVPVIGSDSGEIPLVIGEAGRVVAEADASAWAKTIAELLASPDLREQLRSCGFSRAPRYSVATIAQQYRDYYHWLAERRVGLVSGRAPNRKTSDEPKSGRYAK